MYYAITQEALESNNIWPMIETPAGAVDSNSSSTLNTDVISKFYRVTTCTHLCKCVSREKLRCSFALSAFPMNFFVCHFRTFYSLMPFICIFVTYFLCAFRPVNRCHGSECSSSSVLYEFAFQIAKDKAAAHLNFPRTDTGKNAIWFRLALVREHQRRPILVSHFSSADEKIVCTILITARMA